jgi:hypothetical protein
MRLRTFGVFRADFFLHTFLKNNYSHHNMTRPAYYAHSPARGCGWLVPALAVTVVTSAIAMILVAPQPAYSQRRPSPPRLLLEKARYDFGETFAGEDLTHAFWVYNNGSTPLELSERPLLTTRPAKTAAASSSFRDTVWKLLAVRAMAGAPPPT